MEHPISEPDVIHRLLAARRIAVVGVSDDRSRPSHAIASYLQSVEKEIIPINPNISSWSGLKVYASLRDVPDKSYCRGGRNRFCPESLHHGGTSAQPGMIRRA